MKKQKLGNTLAILFICALFSIAGIVEVSANKKNSKTLDDEKSMMKSDPDFGDSKDDEWVSMDTNIATPMPFNFSRALAPSDKDFGSENMKSLGSAASHEDASDIMETIENGAEINTETLEENIKSKAEDPFDDLASSMKSKESNPFSSKFLFFNADAVIGSMGKKRKLTKINRKTGKPYGVVALVCLRCHTDLHIAHPLETPTTKVKIPLEASFPLGSQGAGLTCRSCHVKMNNNYKFLRWPTDGGEHKEKFCVHCHPEKGKSANKNRRGDDDKGKIRRRKNK